MEQGTVKYSLPDTIAKFRQDDSDVEDEEQHPVRVGLVQMQNWRLCQYIVDVLRPPAGALGFIRLGLLSDHDELKNLDNQVKLGHLDRLIRRCGYTDSQDAAKFTRRMLIRFESLEQQIRLQYSNSDVFENKNSRWNDSRKMLQQLLLDSAFILEQLLQHWEAGTRGITVMRPGRHRPELIMFGNQIPYTLLQELMQAVKLPTAALPEKWDNFLMRIAIGYIIAEDASEWLLTRYKGPVHHLLHLVHLHLASAVEQRLVVAPPRGSSSSSSPWPCCKAFYRAAKNKAALSLMRAHGGTKPSSLQETAWWSYSMLPPACDLNRVGIRFRPPKKATRCLADARFRDMDGVLELPQLELEGFDFLLLRNLFALELEWEWDSSQRLFLSYVVFLSNLIRSENDLNLLQGAGVVVRTMINTFSDGNLYWLGLKILAELNNGHELHAHFVRLARQVKGSYDRLYRAAPCTTSSCFRK